MKNIKDYKKMVANEDVIILSNITDINKETDESAVVSEFELLLEAGSCGISVLDNSVTFTLYKSNMDQETIESTMGFFEELNRYRLFNETCPENHVNIFSMCITSLNEDDNEGLMFSSPVFWGTDDSSNTIKIVFTPETVSYVQGD